MPRLIEMAGRVFGKLTVLRRVEAPRGSRAQWWCRCECGREQKVDGGNLRQGRARSCAPCAYKSGGDKLVTHGQSRIGRRSRTYGIWGNIIQRCANPKDRSWPDYGGRGIKVCERWLSFENFLADMGERPPGMTVERKDNDGDYEPGNCVWATRAQQMRNYRRNHVLTLDGESHPMIVWSERLGISYNTIRWRAARRLSDEQILAPPRRRNT